MSDPADWLFLAETDFRAALGSLENDAPNMINPDLKELEQSLIFLNRFYIPTRYPEALPGSLAENLPTKEMAKQAIEYAEEIFKAIKEKF